MAVQRALRRGNVMVRKTRSHVSKVQLTSETLSRLTTTERHLPFDVKRSQLVELPEGLISVKEEFLAECVSWRSTALLLARFRRKNSDSRPSARSDAPVLRVRFCKASGSPDNRISFSIGQCLMTDAFAIPALPTILAAL